MPKTARRNKIAQGPMMFPAAPLTKNEATIYGEFHNTEQGVCRTVYGPRGGQTIVLERWRRNGMVKEWVRTDNFRVPVTYGYSGNQRWGYITQDDVLIIHPAYRCPAGLH